MFLSSACLCIYLFVQTAREFASNHVTTRVSRIGDLSTTQVSFCNQNILLSDYAINLFLDNNLTTANVQLPDYIALQNLAWNKTGKLLTFEERSRFSDINQTVISCTFNGQPCEFRFELNLELGCYTVKRPKATGNIDLHFLLQTLNRLLSISYTYFRSNKNNFIYTFY